jgi:diaminopimelate epimerase
MADMTHPLVVTKHHGLGNDFLVARDPSIKLGPLHARRWCDRRRGIGADGLLVLRTEAGDDGVDARMVLYNADGSRAEMSGNGIRCLVQALHRAHHPRHEPGRVARYLVRTDAGVRDVSVVDTDDPDTVMATVAMGVAEPLEAPEGWETLGCDPLRPVLHLSLGNPHSVVAVDDVSIVELAELGALVPQINLEIVEPGPEDHAITMRVHERGAGITEACGTGATAAAYAAHRWGLARGKEIVVHMDGGDAIVRVEGELTLTGPATFVATIEVS